MKDQSANISPGPIATVRILQIGDVHYPDWHKERATVDDKDGAFPSDLKEAISIHPVQLVLREIARRSHAGRYDLTALMGDITSAGKFDKFVLALRQLSLLLDVKRNNKGAQRVVLVPGNHDVSRDLAITDGIEGKFAPINKALAENGWSHTPIRDIRRIDVDGAQGSVSAFLLNTCLGCGEPRYIPSIVKDALVGTISSAIATPAMQSVALDEYYEQLDTPALDDKAIRRIASELTDLSSSKLPVFIAHHNLLPQREARVAPYAELINAGQLRRVLLHSDRPTLYLHGHIHDDPVEIISDPTHPRARIVSISAPALARGFNEIIIYVASDGEPCGCRVIPVRLAGAAGLSDQTPIDIPLTTRAARVRSQLGYLVLEVATKGRSMFWAELYAQVQKKIRSVQDSEVAATVLELYFASYVKVDRIDRPPNEWRISVE